MRGADVELAAPVARARRSRRRLVVVVFSAAALLLAALLAAGARGGPRRRGALEEASLDTTANDIVGGAEEEQAVTITQDDLNAAAANVRNDLESLPTEQAAAVRGSVPTAVGEADAIIDGSDYVKGMGDPYTSVTGPHSDDAAEADAIINNANAEVNDVTGKAGATVYAAASDPDAPQSAWIRGSIPNYRAESKLITSGVAGNFEKQLENDPVMAVAGGKVPARQVAYAIVDESYKDHSNVVDCTGVVDKDGKHGIGRGTPPCPPSVAFKKPTIDVQAVVDAADAAAAATPAAAEGPDQTQVAGEQQAENIVGGAEDAQAAKQWKSCEASFSGLRGNEGGPTGVALCCASECDQCGIGGAQGANQQKCMDANQQAQGKKSKAWVRQNCCMYKSNLSKCKNADAPPCKCEKQGKCKKM